MLPPPFDDDLRLLQRVEDFTIEQFVTELRVEALAIAILRSEALFLHYRVLQPLGIESGTALEIGCGTGLHSEALRLLIGDAHGVDNSAVAIELARNQFPEVRFTLGDALEVLRKSQDLDVVFSRGMSWFHYELRRRIVPVCS